MGIRFRRRTTGIFQRDTFIHESPTGITYHHLVGEDGMWASIDEFVGDVAELISKYDIGNEPDAPGPEASYAEIARRLLDDLDLASLDGSNTPLETLLQLYVLGHAVGRMEAEPFEVVVRTNERLRAGRSKGGVNSRKGSDEDRAEVAANVFDYMRRQRTNLTEAIAHFCVKYTVAPSTIRQWIIFANADEWGKEVQAMIAKGNTEEDAFASLAVQLTARERLKKGKVPSGLIRAAYKKFSDRNKDIFSSKR